MFFSGKFIKVWYNIWLRWVIAKVFVGCIFGKSMFSKMLSLDVSSTEGIAE